MKRKIKSIIIMMIGLGFFSYPFFSFTINDFRADSEGKEAVKSMQNMDLVEKAKINSISDGYSKFLNEKGTKIEDPFYLDKNQKDSYTPYKDMGGKNNGVMGYLVIPAIGVKNAIYIGATDDNLMKGVAQVEGTDMPYGGKGRRCVIAGHRGTYRVSMMFRHLDRLKKGDDIYIYNIDGRLHYRVSNMSIILPSETDKLLPKEDKDMLSLITCDPFPTGGKRLLIDSERVRERKKGNNQVNMVDQFEKDIQREESPHTKRIRQLNHLAVVVSIVIYIILIYKLISALVYNHRHRDEFEEGEDKEKEKS